MSDLAVAYTGDVGPSQVPPDGYGSEPSAVLGIDYDEFDPTTYRAITLSITGLPPARFASGDPLRDWEDAVAACADLPVYESSSVHNFIMDANHFRAASTAAHNTEEA